MKNKTVVVHEGADWIYISESGDKNLNESQYKYLLDYLLQTFGHIEMLLIKSNRFMFVNYVGFIKLDTIYLEILPKISLAKDSDVDRVRLIEMLIKSRDLPIKLSHNLQDIFKCKNLLDMITELYISELSDQLNRGVFKEYVNDQENRHSLKGKLLLNEHARTNRYRKNMVFCSYDEYTENNWLNQVLKLALNILSRNHQNIGQTVKINKLFGYYSEVDDIILNDNLFSAVNLNRQNQRYELLLQMAKIILFRLYSKNREGKAESFSMLFEMNVLYEKYIAYVATKIAREQSIKIKKQDKEKHLLLNRISNRKAINLKPDIVLETEDKTLIIDTKWKSIIKEQQLNYAIADIYQMYAYVTRYEKAGACILLYPQIDSHITFPELNLYAPYDKRVITIADVRLDTEQNANDCIKELLLNYFNQK